MKRLGLLGGFALCGLLLPLVLSAAALVDVYGEVLVDSGSGFAPVMEGPLKAGDRVILIDKARAGVAYDDCRVQVDPEAVYTVVAAAPCRPAQHIAMADGGTGGIGSAVDTASLSGFVWRDLNNNRSWEAAERKLGGIRVALVNESCQLGIDCPMVTTDSDGNYGFASVVPGTYSVTVVGDDDDDRTVVAVVTLSGGGAYKLDIGLNDNGFVAAVSGLEVAKEPATAASVAVGPAAAVGVGVATAGGSAPPTAASIAVGVLAVGGMALMFDDDSQPISP